MEPHRPAAKEATCGCQRPCLARTTSSAGPTHLSSSRRTAPAAARSCRVRPCWRARGPSGTTRRPATRRAAGRSRSRTRRGPSGRAGRGSRGSRRPTGGRARAGRTPTAARVRAGEAASRRALPHRSPGRPQPIQESATAARAGRRRAFPPGPGLRRCRARRAERASCCRPRPRRARRRRSGWAESSPRRRASDRSARRHGPCSRGTRSAVTPADPAEVPVCEGGRGRGGRGMWLGCKPLVG